MSQPILQIENLHIEFKTDRGRLRAINGISLEVQPGQIFGIVGETGCGKTITGLSVMRLLPKSARISEGRIRVDGIDMLKLSERELRDLRGGRIAMIFQDPTASLNPVFTIGEQMVRVIRTHSRRSKRAARQEAGSMLSAVGLPDVERIMKSYPHQLSGGMIQRAMIAMALSCRPALIIADEPTTALDVTIQAQILALLRDLQRKFGIAVVLITHNLGVIAQTCDRLAVLYAGQVVESGPTEAIFNRPHHPYTRGLMQAVPRLESRGQALVAIPGAVPADPGTLTGCAFAPRCPHVFERCLQQRPPLSEQQSGHFSACFLDSSDFPDLSDSKEVGQ